MRRMQDTALKHEAERHLPRLGKRYDAESHEQLRRLHFRVRSQIEPIIGRLKCESTR